MRARLLAALLLLSPALGCVGPQPRPATDEGDWAVARRRALRSGKLYDGLTTNAFVTTVYQGRELREARVARVAAWKVLTVPETEKLLASERDEASRYEDFLVFLFTPDRLDTDMDSLRSGWAAALVAPGEPDRRPEGVRVVRADPMLRQLYPEIGDFDTVYLLRFPRTQPLESRPFTLRLAGAKGRLDFHYGPEAPPPSG